MADGEEGTSSVPDDETVYRRIPNVQVGDGFMVVDERTQQRRPSSALFRLHKGEDGLSVYRDSVLRAHALGPSDLVRRPLNGVLALGVRDVRAQQLDVHDDPWPKGNTDEPEHHRNAAHALVVGIPDLPNDVRKLAVRALIAASRIVLEP